MRILVTGSAGFIGGHLCRELREHGHRIEGFDIARAPWDDVMEYGQIEPAVGDFAPDVVVHLAAQVGRLFGEDDIAHTIGENAIGTANVARAAAAHGARLVYASTSEVYGDRGDQPCYEEELYDRSFLPHNIYGLSKRWGEEACRLYAPEGLLVWRISMPYGPGLPAGRGRAAICNFLDQAQRRATIPVHGGSERSWCYISDTVRAMRMTIEWNCSGAFNIGRDDDARPLIDVARIACDLTGAPWSLIEEVDAPARQTVVKRLATDKIRNLGWEPAVPLRCGMRFLLNWMNAEQEEAA